MKVSYRAAAHDVQHFSTWADEVTTAKKPQNGDENRAKEMSLAECSAEFTKYGALAEELRSQAEKAVVTPDTLNMVRGGADESAAAGPQMQLRVGCSVM